MQEEQATNLNKNVNDISGLWQREILYFREFASTAP